MLKGRINRATFWIGVGGYVALSLLFSFAFNLGSRGFDVILVILAILRLHDLGRTGWWVVPPVLLQLAAAVGAAIWLPEDQLPLAVGAVVLVVAGLLAWIGAPKGQPGPNRFGDPPPPGAGYRPPRR